MDGRLGGSNTARFREAGPLMPRYLAIHLQPQLVEAAGGVGSVPRRVEVLGHATHAQRPQCARGRRERATARCQPAQHGAVERAQRDVATRERGANDGMVPMQ